MASPHPEVNNVRPLKAWEGVSSWEGVRTRHRSAKIDSLAKCQSPSLESREVSSANENGVLRSQPQGGITGHLCTTSESGQEAAKGTGFKIPTRRPVVIVKGQRSVIEREVTSHDQDAFDIPGTMIVSEGTISKTAVADEIHTQEDGEQEQKDIFCSPEHAPRTTLQQQESLSHRAAVFEPNLPEQMPTPHTEHDDRHNNCKNKPFSPPDTSPDIEMDDDTSSDTSSHISSDITAHSGQEAIDQLKAINEDLRSEGNYYRLMAEIALKTVLVRRG